MSQMLKFLASGAGRILRAVVGLILIALGIWVVSGVWSWVLIVIGLVPLAAGLFDFCVFAPLFGLAFTGERLRHKLTVEEE
jgi:hypothetical protein